MTDIHALAFEFGARVVAAIRAHGLDVTEEEWKTIAILQDLPGLTTTALADKKRRDKTTVTRMIDRLVQKGLVERRVDPNDRRIQRLFLTRSGYEASSVLTRIADDLAEQIFSGIDREQIAQSASLVERVLASGGKNQ